MDLLSFSLGFKLVTFPLSFNFCRGALLMIKGLQKGLNFVGVLGLCLSVCFGFFMEFYYLEKPCPLCFLQRAMMIGTAIGLYLNLAKGVQIKHYALSLLWIILGFSCSLRHMALNVCKKLDVPPFLFMSHRIYTWSFIVFFLAFLGVIALLFLYRPIEKKEEKNSSRALKLISISVLLATLSFGVFSILLRRGFAL